MLLGTRKVSSSSVAFVSSTAENQRLKVSALTCGLSAADNFSQMALHLSSIQNLLTPKSAFLEEAGQRRALIKVAENVKIILLVSMEKWRCPRPKITFFRGKME